MFGPNTEIELNLLELEAALPSLHGVAMELDDCAFPLLKRVVCTSELSTAMDGVNWALLVGSVPRKQGMERSDLLKINGGIFTAQGKAINDNASDDVRVFVVGNPCNTNCLIAMHNAKDIPHDRFFAMTTLDELRAKTFLAKKAGVSVSAVTNMTIWGNHSATQFPDAYHAMIDGHVAAGVINDEAWIHEAFISSVQQRGAEVIKARGASSAASAANAVIKAVNNLVFDSHKDETFSMALASNGEYGVDKDLIFSFPCTNHNGKIQVVENWHFNSFSQEKFNLTLNELRQERDAVKAMGLI
jgi:malate dehydrogenase